MFRPRTGSALLVPLLLTVHCSKGVGVGATTATSTAPAVGPQAGTVAVGSGTASGLATATNTGKAIANPGASTYAAGTVALSVANVPAGGASLTGASLSLGGQPTPQAGQDVSFTPTKYIIPINTIFLINSKKTNALQVASSGTASAGGTESGVATATGTATGSGQGGGASAGVVNPNNFNLYACSGSTEADCNLDLADNAALATKFAKAATVPVGTFDEVGYTVVCENSGFTIGVQSPAAPNGLVIKASGGQPTTYYTTASGDLSVNAADLAPAATMITGGCGATTYKLPTPITVTAGASLSVSLFLSDANIAWAGTDGSNNPGGCAAPTPATGNFVCTNLPAFVPFAGDFSPASETYAIQVNNPSPYPGFTGGQVVILVDSNTNDAVGAFFMRLYSYTPATGTGTGTGTNTGSAVLSNTVLWDAGVVSFTQNPGSPATYDIASSVDPGEPGPRGEIKQFTRLSTVGATATGIIFNGGNNTVSAYTYTATRVN